MPSDDERKRRRLGDETKSRIADLASGWSVNDGPAPRDDPDTAPEPAQPPSAAGTPRPTAAPPPAATPAAPAAATPAARAITDSSGVMAIDPAAAPPTRNKPKTNPPPPPGSPERKAIEEKIIATTKDDRDDPTVPREPTGAQPIVRPKGQTGQQPIAPSSASPGTSPRTKGSTGQQPIAERAKGSTGQQPVIDRSKPMSTSPSGERSKPTTASPSRPAIAKPDPAKLDLPDPSGWSVPSPVSDAELPPTASGSLTAQQLPDKAPKAGPRYPRAGYDGPNTPFQTESKTFTSEQRTPPVIVDSSLSTPELMAAASAAANTPVPANAKAPVATAQPKVFPGNSTSRIQAGPTSPASTATSRPTVPSGEFDNAAKTVPDDRGPTIASSTSRKDDETVVPTGEFDSGAGTLEQLTLKREESPGAAARAAIVRAGTAEKSAAAKAGGAGKLATRVPKRAETPAEELSDDDVEDFDDDVESDDDSGVRRVGDEHGGGGRGIGISVDPYLQARGDATTIDPQTNKFERGDPTQDKPPDATEIQAPSEGGRRHHVTGGTLRPSAALRRKRGLWGDVRYVFTAVFGVRQSRRELAELEHRQELRQTSRKRHLVTLGRTAVVTDAFDHPALGKARDQLQRIEEERGRHAGAVAASDAELERVRRDRETKSKELVELTMKTDAELAELAKKLEPLEKEAAGVKRRAQELRETIQRIDKKIADTEALMVSVKGEKMDKAAIQADIVTFKADKEAVLRDEPVIAAQLDALNPRIAAIEASRSELQKKKVEAQKAEEEDQRRTSELLAAIGAKRKVVERAAAEAEQARDATLLDLGDKLYVDRPKSLSNLLSPVDQIDLELGEGDRRIMELREILSNIDRWKFSRGLAMIIVTLALAGCFVWWLVAMLT